MSPFNRRSGAWFLLPCLFLWLLSVSSADGQQYQIVRLTLEDDGSEQIEEIASSDNRAIVARLTSRISDMDLACQLTDEQRQKLKVVLKGTAKRLDHARREALKKQADQFAGRVISFSVVPQSPAIAENDKLWKRTANQILDKEQIARYEAWNAEREKFLRKSSVDAFVARLDMKLFLSADQRRQLVEIIDREFGEKLVEQARKDFLNPRRGRFRGNQEPMYVDLVNKILNPSQLDEWKRSCEEELQLLGN